MDSPIVNDGAAVAALRASSAWSAWAASRSPSGLNRTFSSLKRFRAEIGGQFRILTSSSTRNSGQCGTNIEGEDLHRSGRRDIWVDSTNGEQGIGWTYYYAHHG